ncbi:uncharacterized protein LOC128680151 [Plodia interpunctella]|uniref:uncharacterized protein LOC128680151 n=1 Tax=Plodia interpunctella TaxID=58824 RepID=UPI00236782E0|nr:uncharacterized protein LOC128680151 [Plodia interpunctella]
MRCWIVIAVFIAVSFAAPLDSPTTPAPPEASTGPENSIHISHDDKIPLVNDQLLPNQSMQQIEKKEVNPTVSPNNIDQPNSTPVLEQNENEPLVNSKPDANIQEKVPISVQESQTDKTPLPADHYAQETSTDKDQSLVLNNYIPEAKPNPESSNPQILNQAHHVYEHILNERPDKPILQPIEQKPISDEDDEDSDEKLDIFQALGLLALNYELELLEEMEQLERKMAHYSHGHKQQENHGHSHSYVPSREDLLCDCNALGADMVLPKKKHGRIH